MISLDPTTALEVAVTGTSTRFGATMDSHSAYVFSTTTDTWIAQGATPTATVGAGSSLVPAGTMILIDGVCGADLAVLQDSAAGRASLTRARRL